MMTIGTTTVPYRRPAASPPGAAPAPMSALASVEIPAGTAGGHGPADPVGAADLPDAVGQAIRQTEAGDLAAVVAVLHVPLAHLDPTAPTVHVVDGAALYAHALAGTGHLGPALQWATWAHRASQTLHPHGDRRAVRPVQVHAALLAATGNTGLAVAVYRDLVGLLTTLDGPTVMRTLCARADLAVALHRHGACPTDSPRGAGRRVDTMRRPPRRAAPDRHPHGHPPGHDVPRLRRPRPGEAAVRPSRHDAATGPAGGPVANAAGRPANTAHSRLCTHTPGRSPIHWPHPEGRTAPDPRSK